MKRRLPVSISVLMLLPFSVFGQALVEYGLGAARSTAVTPAQGVGKSMSGILNSLTKTLQDGAEPAAIAPRSAPAAAARQPKALAAAKVKATDAVAAAAPAKDPPKPTVVYEDPAGIKVGMEYAELMRRFGEPSMKITSGTDRQTMWYAAKDRRVELEVKGGKVASMQSSVKAPQTAVVVLQ